MDYGKPSPFELWRRENLSNMAVSKEILELIAKAFEDGQLSEREACAEICDGISEWYETRTDLNQTQKQVGQLAAEVCGVRIRERGEK
jgi:hypothetical protein